MPQRAESNKAKPGKFAHKTITDSVVVRKRIPEIGAHAGIVYWLIASMAGRNKCFPISQRYMARTLGFSPTTIKNAVRTLEKAGLIRVERKTEPGKREHARSVYHVLDLQQGGSRDDAHVSQRVTHGESGYDAHVGHEMVNKEAYLLEGGFRKVSVEANARVRARLLLLENFGLDEQRFERSLERYPDLSDDDVLEEAERFTDFYAPVQPLRGAYARWSDWLRNGDAYRQGGSS